eukprot:CAMPEP_0172203240 /NCGR_PEP_ID=MMETSP1050-20130122/31157_1 /TAXON_ID=233186 /ORGANISM="Cryptomonas curvata, Strain CCAP979/52" /LENGTH=61 /DNA_ID=CAMNT_0012881399 /DNA_START=15 /DNA_END=197 /DNA_ORIENTATION=+
MKYDVRNSASDLEAIYSRVDRQSIEYLVRYRCSLLSFHWDTVLGVLDGKTPAERAELSEAE